ncbi:NAD(P)-binding protein [Meira miltonrushii]|uniref:NAD(P)-binding protein n=1 Tax=Meira miltonrushii TaxID=1280837 RepID=A0A316VH15_9BASI|nr:NAD(P)-binding protein [Meira miltonrushii]PWN36810.1 NAD(P)-binding protein [Meira miltonrushii]
MASTSTLTPALPPTANLKHDFTLARLLCSYVYAAFSALFTKLSSLFCSIGRSPGPQIPWPKRRVGDTDDYEELYFPLSDTITIVTGANSGVGYEIAKAHFRKGSTVILACRDLERGDNAVRTILQEEGLPESDVENECLQVLVCDTSSLESVRAFARCFKAVFKGKKIDFLFLNAGICQKPYNIDRFTSEGLEYMYATNFLGHFLLTGLLSSSFSKDVRIISTSALAASHATFDPQLLARRPNNHEQTLEVGFHTVKRHPILARIFSLTPLDVFHIYGQGKAMQIAFSNTLQNRFDQSARSKNATNHKFTAAFHPGVVATNIFKGFYTPDQKHGAQTGLWLAHTFDARPGAFYDRAKELTLPWYKSYDQQLADRLWQRWNNDAGLKESDWHF